MKVFCPLTHSSLKIKILKKTLRLFISLCLFCTSAASANTIWIKHPQVSRIEFDAFISTEEKAQSFSEYVREQLASKSNRLLDSIAEAQISYLKAEADALEKWLSVKQMALDALWSGDEKSALLSAYLRAAQLMAPTEARSKLISEARAFAGLLQADEKIFAPPFVREFKSIETKTANFKTTALFKLLKEKNLDFVSLNSTSYSTKNIMLPLDFDFRLDLISESYLPLQFTGSIEKLRHSHFSISPLLTNFCESSSLSLEALELIGGHNYKVYTGSHCKKGEAPLIAAIEPKSSVDQFKPILSNQARQQISATQTPMEIQGSQKNWYKNKWVWIGLGVVVAGIAYSQRQTAPTDSPKGGGQKEGF